MRGLELSEAELVAASGANPSAEGQTQDVQGRRPGSIPGCTGRPWGQPNAVQPLRESRGGPHLEPLRPARLAGTQASRGEPAASPRDRMG